MTLRCSCIALQHRCSPLTCVFSGGFALQQSRYHGAAGSIGRDSCRNVRGECFIFMASCCIADFFDGPHGAIGHESVLHPCSPSDDNGQRKAFFVDVLFFTSNM
jgi:hypothetical protein